MWGSWWNSELGWGFACCHGTDRNAVCLGDRGKKIAIVKEYRIVKKRETDLKAQDFTEDVKKDLRRVKDRIEALEEVIEHREITINMEQHKHYTNMMLKNKLNQEEKMEAEEDRKKEEDKEETQGME